MNNSTQDSQELIEGLGKAGGGLSSGRAFFFRHTGFPFLNSIVPGNVLWVFLKKREKKYFHLPIRWRKTNRLFTLSWV